MRTAWRRPPPRPRQQGSKVEGKTGLYRLAAVRPLLVSFAGGGVGSWAVSRLEAVVGASLQPVSHLEVIEGEADPIRSLRSVRTLTARVPSTGRQWNPPASTRRLASARSMGATGGTHALWPAWCAVLRWLGDQGANVDSCGSTRLFCLTKCDGSAELAHRIQPG